MFQGERGKTGDHGQTGDTGETGKTGLTGAVGARGKPAPRRALIGYIIMAAFMVGVSYVAWHSDQAAKKAIMVNCNFGNQNREVLRVMLQDANRRTQTSKQRTPEEKAEAQEFYGRYLEKLEPFNCKQIIEDAMNLELMHDVP